MTKEVDKLLKSHHQQGGHFWMNLGNRLAFGVALTGLFYLVSMGVYVTPAFTKMFQETGVAIPMITKMVISIPPIAYLIIGTVFGLLLLIKEIRMTRREDKLAINVIALIGLQVWFALYGLALFMPMIQIMKKL